MRNVFILSLFLGSLAAGAQEAPSFEKDIQPIFAERCAGCHFPPAKLKAGLDLSTGALTLKGGDSGASIVPGKAGESPLVQMIEHTLEPEMPPKGKGEKLPQEEIDLIRKWIDAGAPHVPTAAPAEAAPAPASPASTTPAAAPAHPAPVSAIAFSPDGKLLARGGMHEVTLWSIDPAAGTETAAGVLAGHADSVRALAFSPDGAMLAAAGGKPGKAGEVILWNLADKSQLRTLTGHTDNILDVAFSPDGVLLATCSYDRLVKLWDVAAGTERNTFKDHVDAVNAVAFSPDGKTLASGAGDRTVKFWDVEKGERMLTLSDSTDAVQCIAFDPSGKYLAAGAADKMIRVWDLAASGVGVRQGGITSSVITHSTFAHAGPVLELAYAPDGKTLYSTAEDKLIKVWDTDTMAERLAYAPQTDWVMALALSRDGAYLAAGRYDASSTVYDAATGKAAIGADVLQVAAAEPKKTRNINVDAVLIDATIPPVVTAVQPTRTHRGAELEMVIEGKNLAEAQIHFTDPKITFALVASEALPIPEFNYDPKSTGAQIYDQAQPYRLKLKVNLPADMGSGGKEVIVRTPLGFSSGVFQVLPRPDVGETEPNDAALDAPAAPFPVTFIGSMNSETDVDRYKVHLEAGKEIVAALTDVAPNTVLRVLNAKGEQIAHSDQFNDGGLVKVGFRAAEAGDYFIEFSDPNLRRGIGYRLHVGEFPYVHTVFPLGVKAGGPQKVPVQGFNIGGVTELEVDPPDTALSIATMPLPLPGVEGNPIPAPSIAVAAYDEFSETEPNDAVAQAQTVPVPSTTNARLAVSGEADVYKFMAEPGKQIVIETLGARLGSPIDTVIEITDAQGNVLQQAQARCVAKAMMTLSDRDSRSGGIRIDNWSDFRVNDYVVIGSEVLKVTRLPGYADEDLSIKSHPFGQRIGFFGTTPQHHAVGSPFYKVEIHPVGVQFAPNGMPVFPLFWRNDDFFEEGKRVGDSQLVFEAPAPGEYYVRVRDAGAAGSDRHAYRLMLRPLEPDYDVVLDSYHMNMSPGESEPLLARVRRRDGFDAPVTVQVHDLPAGFSAAPEIIPAGEDDVVLAVRIAPDAKSTELGANFRVTAVSMLNGAEVTREARIGSLTVAQKEPDIRVRNAETKLAIRPGESQWLSIKLERQNGFSSRVPINVLNLPFGVRVLDTGLNGILVREGETERSMEIFVEPWVKPMKQNLYVQARIEAPSNGRLLFISEPIVLDTSTETLAAAETK